MQCIECKVLDNDVNESISLLWFTGMEIGLDERTRRVNEVVIDHCGAVEHRQMQVEKECHLKERNFLRKKVHTAT